MGVGGGLLGQRSIFEIDSTYCSSKDYILYVMIRLFEFDATAKAMDDRALDPVKIERFKQMCINVEQKHIQTCGCPPDGPAQQMRNLQQLVSQPSPKTSAAEFYDSIILNELVSHTNLKKLNLLYKAKPFDFNKSILSAIKSQPIEVPELVFNLAKHGNLNTLPLLEDKLICTKGPYVASITIKTGAGHAAETSARVVLELCGSKGGCCQTSTNGRGLDNPGNDRRNGQTDVYTAKSILGKCAEQGILGSPARATLTTSDPDGHDGWYVEWIEITMNTGEKSLCPFNAWLDNGAPGTRQAVNPSTGRPSDPAGTPSATSICNQGDP